MDQNRIKEYLAGCGMSMTWADVETAGKCFTEHMRRGLAGEPSGLPMLPSYLSVGAVPGAERPVIAVDAGGSHLRVYLAVLRGNGTCEVLRRHDEPMPGKEGPLDADAFFKKLALAVLPVAEESGLIGFCFSFACRMLPDHDGEILGLDKELQVEGIRGERLGARLLAALRELGVRREHRVVVLNDTTAALLGTCAAHPGGDYSGRIGLILGTGVNCCYEERNGRVLKEAALRELPGSSIINVESGAFDGLTLTEADRLLAARTLDPERNLLEKMTGGAYQGPLLDCLLEAAARDGVLSPAFARRLQGRARGTTAADISFFMENPAADGFLRGLAETAADRRALYLLADALLERAARLAVMTLTAVMDFTGAGRDPLRPVFVAIEGTTYEKSAIFKQKIRRHLERYAKIERGLHCSVFRAEGANCAGSVLAAAAEIS